MKRTKSTPLPLPTAFQPEGGSSSPVQQACLVLDLDNTLLDTTIRKLPLLREMFPERSTGIGMPAIRDDYWLTSVLGDRTHDASRSFFAHLDSRDAIQKYPAPLFEGSREAVDRLRSAMYRIVIVTARPESLRAATLRELKRAGLEIGDCDLLMNTDPDSTSPLALKTSIVRSLDGNYRVAAYVGDRGEDVRAAHLNGIPAILLTSTLRTSEILELQIKDEIGLTIATSWAEVPGIVQGLAAGTAQMRSLRDMFIGQYSDWLSDIDRKASTSVALAGVLTAVSGKLLIDPDSSMSSFHALSRASDVILSLAFLSAVFSLLYSIMTYTARQTSGNNSGQRIRSKMKQLIGILFGKSVALPGDPIDQYRRLRESSQALQAHQHQAFFYDKYRSYNADALMNFRLYELRASNYSKLYAERIASKLLVCSIVLLVTWTGLRFFAHDLSSSTSPTTDPPKVIENDRLTSASSSPIQFIKSHGEAQQDASKLDSEQRSKPTEP